MHHLSRSFNLSLEQPTVRTTVKFLGRHNALYKSDLFIQELGYAEKFPVISTREYVGALKRCGAPLLGLHASLSEMKATGKPFLTFLKASDCNSNIHELVPVEFVDSSHALLWADSFEKRKMPLEKINERWTGIVFLLDMANKSGNPTSDCTLYKSQISIIPGFISKDDCSSIIEMCQDIAFDASKIAVQTKSGIQDIIDLDIRSSLSTVFKDRSDPILKGIYEKCANIEGVADYNIEDIQCVRYSDKQLFRSHYDGGASLPRLTTFLLYLNDDFEGGDTYFPMLDLNISPVAGSCLRFPSCDYLGRVLWPSEHGGLPVSTGVKYALNIWVRCPPILTV